MDDINVFLIDFGRSKVNEEVCLNEDGSYSIFINSRLSAVGQKEAYQHAMKHIENNDFQKTDVQEIEARAHEAKAVKSVVKPKMKFKNTSARKRKEVEEKVAFLQEYTFEHNIDYNDFIMRRWEQKRLYGDM